MPFAPDTDQAEQQIAGTAQPDNELPGAAAQQSEFPKDPHALVAHARRLLAQQDSPALERLFAATLTTSYDHGLWDVYLEYVAATAASPAILMQARSFALSHFEHSYSRAHFLRPLLDSLLDSEDDALKTERIRRIFHRSLALPMPELSALKTEYERWELTANRQSARTFIDQIQPVFNTAQAVYRRLAPFLTAPDSFFYILDIELDNPLRLPKLALAARLNTIFGTCEASFPDREEIPFLRSFFLKDYKEVKSPESQIAGDLQISASSAVESVSESVSMGVLGTAQMLAPRYANLSLLKSSPFLSIWFSFLSSSNLFLFDDPLNGQLILINYLRLLYKTSGVEAVRGRFERLKAQRVAGGVAPCGDGAGAGEAAGPLQGEGAEAKTEAGAESTPHVHLFMAELEAQLGNAREASRLFSEALALFPGNTTVITSFYHFLEKIMDEENLVMLYKRVRGMREPGGAEGEGSGRALSGGPAGDAEQMPCGGIGLRLAGRMWGRGELDEWWSIVEDEARLCAGAEAGEGSGKNSSGKTISFTQKIYTIARDSFGFKDLQLRSQDPLAEFIRKLPILGKTENVLAGASKHVVEMLLAL